MNPNSTDPGDLNQPTIPPATFVPPEPKIIQPTSGPVGPVPAQPAPSHETLSVPMQTTEPKPQFQAPTTPVSPTAAVFQPMSMPSSDQNPVSVFQPVVGSATNNSRKRPSRRKLALFLIPILLLLIGAGVFFGYVVPNQPQNVWNGGLNRSGKALEKLVNNATDQHALDAFEKSEVNAAVDVKYQQATYNGSLNLKFDTTKSNGNFSFSSKDSGNADKVITAKFLSELKSGATYPTIYTQLTGFSAFGLDQLMPDLAKYEGKWLKIDESLLKLYGVEPTTAEKNEEQEFSAADISEFARAISGLTSDYILTSDPQKALLTQRKYYGKETVDTIKAYHYQVGFDKEHSKDFCKVAIDKISATSAYKKVATAAKITDEQKNSAITGCQKSAENDIKDSDTFDMWIDAKYKLIYKLRIKDNIEPSYYVDIGQRYKGGDDIELFVNTHTNNDEAEFTLKTSFKSYVTSGIFKLNGGRDTNVYAVNVTFDAKPYTGEINVSEPAGAIPLQQILQSLGLDPALLSLGAQSKAKDTERQTDIKAIHGQLEAYYAQSGFYPTLANVNSATWRAQNMKGLDPEALKDPEGSSSILVVGPTPNTYAYLVTGENGKTCNNTSVACSAYSLFARLSDGTNYEKQSLN